MTPQEELIRAEQARQLLGNKLVREALDGIKSGLIDQWRAAPVKDMELREQVWAIYVGACKFEEILASFIETGKFAEAQIDHAERQKQGGGKTAFP